MSEDSERLVVLLEARIRDFEKNMAKASGTADRSFGRMRRDSRSATRDMERDMIRSTNSINRALAGSATRIGSFGKTLAGGFAAGIAAGGLAGIIHQVKGVARSVAEVGDAARMAGIDVKSFQELAYVAEQNRIQVDALTDGIKEMNLRADEFILTGKGSGAEAFQRLGLDAETLKRKLEQPSELFSEIIGKLQKFDRAAQIRIADEIFGGTGGEKFVQLIDQGEQGIRDTIKAANDLGIVMDEQLIERAAEVDRRFNAIANTVGVALKTAIVSAADSLAEFIDGFREFENQRNSTLHSKLTDLAQERLGIENEILRLQGEQRENKSVIAGAEGKMLEARIAALKAESQRLNDQEAKILGIIGNRGKPMTRSGSDTWTPPDPSSFITPPRDKAAEKAEREREAVQKLIKELEQEIAISHGTDAEKRALEASRRAGAAATDDERQKIVDLNEVLFQNEKAARQAKEASEFFGETAYDAFMAMVPAIETGNRALDSLINKLIEAVFQATLLGKGPLAGMFGGGLFGGIFGGASSFVPNTTLGGFLGLPSFDGGGQTRSGSRSGGVDGKGGFPALLHPNETIIDHKRSQKISSITAPVNVTIDARGADEGGFERVERQVADLKRKLPSLVISTVKDARKRGFFR